MTNERWEKVQQLFEAALELPPDERADFLAEACADDEALRNEVESLLAADQREHTLLEGFGLNAAGLDEGAGLSQGSVVGAYRILRVIGEGGMGLVYMAERADGEYEQRVALKVVKRGMDSAEILRRFREERQILARLQHPNIGGLLDGGVTDDGSPYFVMEYVDGLPLDEYCDHHRLSIRARLELFELVCDAVRYAHGNLVIHRDLKPENILVTDDGRVKLLDFGIGKVLEGDPGAGDDVTEIGERVLTPAYASPEQLRGEAVSTTTDVYSLGVLLHELLVGRKPVTEDRDRPPVRPTGTLSELDPSELRGIADCRGMRPDRLRRAVSGDLDVICRRALHPDPDRRFNSVEALGSDVRRHLDGLPVQARPDSVGYRFGKFIGRNRAAVSAAVLALLAIGGLTGFYTSRIRAEQQAAQLEQTKADEVASLFMDVFLMTSPEMDTPIQTPRELLDFVIPRIDSLLEPYPELRTDFLLSTGMVYREYGALEVAERQLRRVIELNRELFSEPSAHTIQTTSQLATTLQDLGRYEEAEEYFEEALEAARALPERDPYALAYTLNNLARLRLDMGRYAVAEPPLAEAVDIYASVDRAVEAGYWGTAVRNLARAVSLQGRFEEADSLFAVALEDRLAKSPASPRTAELIYELAEHKIAAGDLAEARRYSDDGLELRRREFPEGHQTIGQSLVQQAELLRMEGRLTEAEDRVREGRAIIEDFVGPEHAWFVDALLVEAAVLGASGDEPAALALRRRAHAMAAERLGGAHPNTSLAAVEVARSLSSLGRADEAIELLRAAVAALAERLGAEHYRTVEARALLDRL